MPGVLARVPLDVEVPAGWVRFSRWTASLMAAAFLLERSEPEVRLIGKGNPTFYPTPAGLKTLRGWAADNLSEDLAEWVADPPPLVFWPSLVGPCAEACEACAKGDPAGGNVDLCCLTCGHRSCEVGA